MEVMSDFLGGNEEQSVTCVGSVVWVVGRAWFWKESRPTDCGDTMGWSGTCVVVRWKFVRSLVWREVKPTSSEEKWKMLVVHLNVFEEKIGMGWYRTMMGVMSDVFEGTMDFLVTCVGLVRWVVGWSW